MGRRSPGTSVDLTAYGFTPEELEGLGQVEPEDPDVLARATQILYEYVLVQHCGLTYPQLGYHTGDGVTVWARKVDEHYLCHALVTEAQDRERDDGKVR